MCNIPVNPVQWHDTSFNITPNYPCHPLDDLYDDSVLNVPNDTDNLAEKKSMISKLISLKQIE